MDFLYFREAHEAAEKQQDVLHRFVTEASLRLAQREEEQLRLYIRPRPAWMPKFIWEWLLTALLYKVVGNEVQRTSTQPVAEKESK